ncbi:MAG: heme exporter protein CcmB [Actinomycetota bacterium]|nr:heme exporter protein CcmB [Actinomycetota bacterium]
MTKILLLAGKDLRSEVRAKQVAPLMIAFSLSLVFLLTFSLPSSDRAPAPGQPAAGTVPVGEVIGTLVWASLLLAAVIGFGRSAASDTEGGLIDALRLAPIDPAAVYAGKVFANLAFLTIAEAAIIPAFALFSGAGLGRLWPGILPVVLGANLGLAAVGTLFGAASQYSTAKSLILAMLMFPVLLPLVLAASRLTSTLLIQGDFLGSNHWFILMSVFDLVFLTIGAVTFEFVIQE